MKNLLILIGIGIVGSGFLYFTPSFESTVDGSNFKTVKYNGVNNQVLDQLKNQINVLAKKSEASVDSNLKTTPNRPLTIEGAKTFQNKLDEVFNYLKTSQLLYRFEFYRSFDSTRSQLSKVSTENYQTLNTKINNLIDYHLKTISQLKTSAVTKTALTSMLGGMKSPLKMIETPATSVQAPAVTAAEIKNLLQTVQNIKKPSSVTMEFHAPETTTTHMPILVLWGVLLTVAAMIGRNTNKTSDIVPENFQADVNPTLKKILAELDYPLFVCDTSFNLTWQNNVSKKYAFNQSQIQNLIAHQSANADETFDLEGNGYTIQISELNYKSGKKNLFVQLKPVAVSSKYTEHLIDATQVESLLENNSLAQGGFKDFNQTVAELAVKMNYLFKVSGKFLDIDFKKDIADCFVENTRLETMCREFMLSCHFLIKDKEQVSGMYMRTDELGQRFALGCFLPGLIENDLTNGLMARDFLKKFSVLEAKFSLCLPTVEIKTVTVGEIKGIDITLSFENRSQMESLINQSFATM